LGNEATKSRTGREEVKNEAVSKAKGWVTGIISIAAAWIFGLLLSLSIILHIIDFAKQ